MKHLVQAFALCFINPQFYRVQAFVPIILPEDFDFTDISPFFHLCSITACSNPDR